jgi:hypothetical protein
MYTGSVYNISAWIRLLPTDGSSHVLNFSLQTTLGGNVSYSSVTAYPGITVPADGAWHQIAQHGPRQWPSVRDRSRHCLSPPEGDELDATAA